MSSLFRLIAKAKNFGGRTASYLTFLNAYMILATFLTVQGYSIPFYFLLPGMVFMVVLIGSIDYFFILKEELAHINSQNDMKHDLQEIKRYMRERGEIR